MYITVHCSCLKGLRSHLGSCGLAAEFVVSLVTNLESGELHRDEYYERGLPFEHPRASEAEDVKGIIATMHEMIGGVFNVKQFNDEQPNIVNELNKIYNFITGHQEPLNVSASLNYHQFISVIYLRDYFLI